MNDLIKFLYDQNIPYERYDHDPVHTVEDVRRVAPGLPGVRTKNLFVRDSKGRRHLLVVTGDEKRVNLNRLSSILGLSRLSFASTERLKRYLGVDPGAVSIFGIVNDVNHEVEVIVDKTLWSEEMFQFHPLVNTSTLVISKVSLERFLKTTGHEIRRIDVPE